MTDEHPRPEPPRSRDGRGPRPERDAREGSAESLRGLSGSGPSQVGVSGAMRARDVSRPREERS